MKVGHIEINVATGEETFTERELTPSEIKLRREREEEAALLKEQEEKLAAEKASLLAQLGITEEQAKLLLG